MIEGLSKAKGFFLPTSWKRFQILSFQKSFKLKPQISDGPGQHLTYQTQFTDSSCHIFFVKIQNDFLAA